MDRRGFLGALAAVGLVPKVLMPTEPRPDAPLVDDDRYESPVRDFGGARLRSNKGFDVTVGHTRFHAHGGDVAVVRSLYASEYQSQDGYRVIPASAVGPLDIEATFYVDGIVRPGYFASGDVRISGPGLPGAALVGKRGYVHSLEYRADGVSVVHLVAEDAARV